MDRIYLDNNASTGIDPRVVQAMLADLCEIPANPSSFHSFGRAARQKLLQARTTISSFLQVREKEIIFNSGGTEGLNTLLRGLPVKGPIISSDVEHSAVFNTLKTLQKEGTPVTLLPAGLWGAVQVDAIEKALCPETRLLILSAVNNETGVKIDMEGIAALAEKKGIPFVVDGVALLGKEPFTIPRGISAMAFSGHKIHAPKGVGFLFTRTPFHPLLTGGDQEFSLRAGTENLAGILGLAKAIELLDSAGSTRMTKLREKLEQSLIKQLGNVSINGEGPRTSNTSNLSFDSIDGETLLIALDRAGIAASHGSACSSGALEPSRILLNMGLSSKRARSSLRLSLSRWTTEEEIDIAIHKICALVQQMHRLQKS